MRAIARAVQVVWISMGIAAWGSSPIVAERVGDRFHGASLRWEGMQGPTAARLSLHLEALRNRLLRARAGPELGDLVEAAARSLPSANSEFQAAAQRAAELLIAEAVPTGRNANLEVCRSYLTGLLAWHTATGQPAALGAARNLADALTRNPHSRAALEPGPALLVEPACVLFCRTGERRQLTQSVSRGLDQPGTPRFLRVIAEEGNVYRAGRLPAADVLLALAGLVELHRLSGEPGFLRAAQAAWQDIVAHRLYLTGAVSAGAHFQDDGVLPGEPSAEVGDARATAAWLRLNWQLFRLSGEPQYAEQIERTFYNHLLASQNPRTAEVARFVPLVGAKDFARTTPEAAASTALAFSLVTETACGALDGAPALALYLPGECAVAAQAEGGSVTVNLRNATRFPAEGTVTLEVRPSQAARFVLRLRVPSWATRYVAEAAGRVYTGRAGSWLVIDRVWQPGDRVTIDIALRARWIEGGASYPHFLALERGPQVLVLERATNPQLVFLHRAAPASPAEPQLREAPGLLPGGWPGVQAYSLDGIAAGGNHGRQSVVRMRLVFVPIADAVEYRVWLPRPDRFPVGPVPVSAFARESWSEPADAPGSICDERADTFRTLRRNGEAEHWYAVEWEAPRLVERIVYRHGKILPQGGWFETARGKPLVQVKRTRDGEWETVGALEAYPVATAERPPELYDGQPFELKLRHPLRIVAVRIVGRPARQLSSCAELAAYAPSASTLAAAGSGSATVWAASPH